jgi:hypothetical protein
MNICCLRSKASRRSLSIASSRIQDRIRQDTAFNCKSDPHLSSEIGLWIRSELGDAIYSFNYCYRFAEIHPVQRV